MIDIKNFGQHFIYNGDVFDLIERLPNLSIDLVLTDPPYGDGTHYGRVVKKTIQNNDDESINYKFLLKIYPKLKQNGLIYIFTNFKFECEIKKYARDILGLNFINLVVLVKNKLGLGGAIRNQHELCLVFEKSGSNKPTFNDLGFSNVLKMKHVQHDDESHPHEKDVDVFRKIILHSSNAGDIVFDGFLGTGNNAVACLMEGRKIIGSEVEEKWYKIIMSKINNYNNQTKLF